MKAEKHRREPNPLLQRYYTIWESRIGYKLLLGGNRHFGYYETGTRWPFPLSTAMKRMENHLHGSLELPAGSKVLDAGCGNGYVALHFARRGLLVQGVDIMENHVRWAQQEIKAHGMENLVTARVGDYHYLDWIPDSSLDGVYTMETFVHAPDPKRALSEFFRVLKPGGSIAMHEYWHVGEADTRETPRGLIQAAERVEKYGAMPTHKHLTEGVLQNWLKDQGFTGIEEVDLSGNLTLCCCSFISLVMYLLHYLLPWISGWVRQY